MTTAAVARLKLVAGTTLGLPKLPHIPKGWLHSLTFEQQEENLLHVALWVVEHDLENFNINNWHQAALDRTHFYGLPSTEQHHSCGTVHCIAGFAQAMCGEMGFLVHPRRAGYLLLGKEAADHFMDSDIEALAFLKNVIDRNS